MRLVFDNIIYSLQRSGGGSVYWTELIKRFAAEFPERCSFIESSGPCENPARNAIHLPNVKADRDLPLRVSRYLPVTVTGPAIFHSSYYRVSLSSTVQNVVTVHDFTHERCFRGLSRIVAGTQKAFAIRRAAGIICVSQNTKNDLHEFFPDLSVDLVRVIPNGVADDFFTVQHIPPSFRDQHAALLQRRLVLYVGHRSPYKNFPIAVDAVRIAGPEFVLGIVGESLSESETAVLDERLPGRYAFLGRVRNEELNLFYNVSHCLIYPSSYEGFGIPVLEAMRASCPVIAASRTSLPEVAGGCAILVDNLDPNDFAREMLRLEADRDLRSRLIADGVRHAASFSWDQTYRMTRDFFTDVERNARVAPDTATRMSSQLQ